MIKVPPFHDITETVRNPIFVESHQMLLIHQRCRPSIKCQMCFFFPRCLWMLIDATIGVDQHSHTHTLSLSVSPLPCFLSPPFLTLYKLALQLCVYQLKYRFHCIWLFSFPRVTQKLYRHHLRLLSFTIIYMLII